MPAQIFCFALDMNTRDYVYSQLTNDTVKKIRLNKEE